MSANKIDLPPPQVKGTISVEAALEQRRSVRSYQQTSLSLQQIAQLLWAAQGLTGSRGSRTTPSAGALYPLKAYLVVGQVNDLPAGVYHYHSQGHAVVQVVPGDQRAALCAAALRQSAVRQAPVVMVICAVYARITPKYGQRGIQYALMEAGHAAQNVCLQAVALGLGSVLIGAFHDQQVREVIAVAADEVPLYLIPIGKP